MRSSAPRAEMTKTPGGRSGEEGGDGAKGAAALLLSANLTHSSIYKHQLPEKHCCLLSINRNHSPMAHPIMRPHTEPRLCRGSPLFFGGQPDSGLDHPTTLPRRLGLWGGTRPSGSDWSVRSMDGLEEEDSKPATVIIFQWPFKVMRYKSFSFFLP